jgi:hypothetical protein
MAFRTDKYTYQPWSDTSPPNNRWATRGVPLLVALTIVLLPAGRLVELPLLALTLYGLYASVRYFPTMWSEHAARTWAGVFLLLWLPMLLALPDAEFLERSAVSTIAFLRLLFMGLGLIALMRTPRQFDTVLNLTGWILSAWVIDGLIQATFGRNLLGNPEMAGSVAGVFYPKQTLGHILAILLPLYALFIARLARRTSLAWLLLPLYCAVILLSGKRAAWLMMFAGLALVGLYALKQLTPAARRQFAGLSLIAACIAGAAAWSYPPFQARIEATRGVFDTDFANFDAATSYRATIWNVATRMAHDHWLNGVGPRAFRDVYPHYAESGDIWMAINPRSGPTHPHQITLEILVETGMIGLAGFIALWCWVIWRARRLWKTTDPSALAWLGAFAVAVLPFNSGHAIYGSMLSGLALVLLAGHFALTCFTSNPA